jgi:hypothetical protein
MGKKKRIIIHIGTHKTGSTTIQKGCCDNRAQLLVNGWLFPVTGMYIFGQHNIAWEMASGIAQPWNWIGEWVSYRPVWGGMDLLLAEIEVAEVETTILSSEDFDGLQTERIQLLREQLADFSVDIVVYLREQASLLQSAWAQFVKSGFIILPFPAFVDEMLASPAEQQRYFGAYDRFLQPWRAFFGAEHVHVRFLSRDLFHDNIFYDFLRTCGVAEVEEYQVPEDQNVSPGLKSLMLTCLFNNGVDSMQKRFHVARLVQEVAYQQGWNDEKLNLISEEIYRMVQAHFAESNAWMEIHYPGWQAVVDRFQPKPLSHFDLSAMTSEEMLTVSQHVLAQLLNDNVPQGR